MMQDPYAHAVAIRIAYQQQFRADLFRQFQYFFISSRLFRIRSLGRTEGRVRNGLGRHFNDKVSVRITPRGNGTITIRFDNEAQVRAFLEKLNPQP